MTFLENGWMIPHNQYFFNFLLFRMNVALLALLAAGTLCFLLHWGALLLQSQRSFISLNSYKTDNGDLFYNFQGLCRLLRSSSIQLLKSAFFPLSSPADSYLTILSTSKQQNHFLNIHSVPLRNSWILDFFFTWTIWFFSDHATLIFFGNFCPENRGQTDGGDIFWAFASS